MKLTSTCASLPFFILVKLIDFQCLIFPERIALFIWTGAISRLHHQTNPPRQKEVANIKSLASVVNLKTLY
jgi:hypothetical protein